MIKSLDKRLKEAEEYMKNNPLPDGIAYSNRYRYKIIGKYIADLFLEKAKKSKRFR